MNVGHCNQCNGVSAFREIKNVFKTSYARIYISNFIIFFYDYTKLFYTCHS